MFSELGHKDKKPDELSHSEVMSIATSRGLKAFTSTAIVTYGLSYLLHHKNSYYNKRFAISAKVGIPLMASLFMGSVFFELSMSDAQKNPEHWENGQLKSVPKTHQRIPLHHWMLNRIHDQPFYFAAAMGLPLIGSVLYARMKEPHLSISQALLQTRVVSYLFYF